MQLRVRDVTVAGNSAYIESGDADMNGPYKGAPFGAAIGCARTGQPGSTSRSSPCRRCRRSCSASHSTSVPAREDRQARPMVKPDRVLVKNGDMIPVDRTRRGPTTGQPQPGLARHRACSGPSSPQSFVAALLTLGDEDEPLVDELQSLRADRIQDVRRVGARRAGRPGSSRRARTGRGGHHVGRGLRPGNRLLLFWRYALEHEELCSRAAEGRARWPPTRALRSRRDPS